MPYNASILGLCESIAGKAAHGVLSALVVTYLFLGGAGAGACLVLAVLGMLVPRESMGREESGFQPARPVRFSPHRPYTSFFIVGYTAALAALALGSVCLMADLGRIDRITLLFVSPVPTLINAGTWSIVCCLALVCAMLASWGSVLRCSVSVVRAMQAVLAGISLFVMLYTGLLLSSIAAVPLWHSVWLPVLFVLSAVSCGIALVIAAAQVAGVARLFRSVVLTLARLDAAIIVFETAALVAFVVFAWADIRASTETHTIAAQAASLDALLQGEAAWAFWGIFVVTGLLVPLFVESFFLTKASGLLRPAPSFCAAVCVLAGGFALRACIVWAGVHPVVSSASAMLIG